MRWAQHYLFKAKSLAFEVGFSFYEIVLISFLLIKLLKTCPEVDRREVDGDSFGSQRHCGFDLGQSKGLSVPSGRVHGATAPWGRGWA